MSIIVVGSGRLEGRKHASLNPITTGVAGKFVKTAAKLRPELTTFRTEVRTARERGSQAFGHVVGGLTREYALRLAEDLKAVRTADDIRVPANILCAGMADDVGAEREWVGQDRGRKRVVDDGKRAL